MCILLPFTKTSRILAEYRAFHVSYHLKISSINLVGHSQVRIENPPDCMARTNVQLIDHVTISVLCKDSSRNGLGWSFAKHGNTKTPPRLSRVGPKRIFQSQLYKPMLHYLLGTSPIELSSKCHSRENYVHVLLFDIREHWPNRVQAE